MIDLHRFPDWERRLADYLESVRSVAFSWGEHDCTLFAAGAVEAMTGVDPMPEFRGKYSTEKGARAALRKYGKGTLRATLDDKFPAIPASHAHRGDIVMTQGLIGICGGAILFAVGAEGEREGLLTLPRTGWVDPRAWRVAY